ncbi:MAG: hypothetical protein DRP08_05795, partial [Candidatus Aenigmatarchaeota archaeon]
RAAFFRGRRDDVTRKQVIADLLKADKDELAQLAKANKRIDKARDGLAKAQRIGNAKSIKAARSELRKAKASARSTKSFLARFETKTQGNFRDATRRQVARASKASFEQTFGVGVKRIWIAVNGSDACPECAERHGLTIPGETGGEPGSGQTYCGASCMCQAIPEEYTKRNPIPEPIVA